MGNRLRGIGGLILLLCIAFPATGRPFSRPEYLPGELLVKFRGDADPADVEALKKGHGLELIRRLDRIGVEHLRIAGGRAVEDVASVLARNPAVEYAEPNYLRYFDAAPNDALFSQLWGLSNLGQTGGTPGADIGALAAWDVATGDPNFVVATIDSGLDMAHPDLAANVFTNPGEIAGNGIDDDGNGYVDDVHGWNFVDGNNDPSDTVPACGGHGTHVAGTIGAAGNNGIGVAGINWSVKIMPLRAFRAVLGILCSAADADLIAAIDYAAAMGVRVTNNSYGGGASSQSFYDAIRASKSLYVAAAGNDGANNDAVPSYPASYNLPNIVAVAATDDTDALAYFSNYGATSVDIAAPGVGILSTTPKNSYSLFDGTSMATPHVVGAAALLWAHDPSLTVNEVKWRLLESADPLGLPVLSGGRLDIGNAIALPAPAVTIDLAPTGPTSVPRGGSVGYSVSVVNASAAQQTVVVSVVAALPDGSEVALVRPTTVVLAPGGSVSKSFSKRIPTNAPVGEYTFFGRAEIASQSYDEDPQGYTVY